jgi:hypothetical protein
LKVGLSVFLLLALVITQVAAAEEKNLSQSQENTTVTPVKEADGQVLADGLSFEAVFAIAGLLAVAFLVLRQRK